MKKIVILLLLLVFFSVPANAAEEEIYSTAGDLYKAWCDDLPDYICGVWSTDGGEDNLTFGVQDSAEGNMGKEEMLRLIKDDNSVSFVYQKYSRNYLLQVLNDVSSYLDAKTGMISAGLNEKQNCIGLEICGIHKDSQETKQVTEDLISKYQDAIYITYTNCTVLHIDGKQEEDHTCKVVLLTQGKSSSSSLHFVTVTLCIVIAVLIFAAIYFKKNAVRIRTNTGEVITVIYTKKALEATIREHKPAFPDNLDTRIMKLLNK